MFRIIYVCVCWLLIVVCNVAATAAAFPRPPPANATSTSFNEEKQAIIAFAMANRPWFDAAWLARVESVDVCCLAYVECNAANRIGALNFVNIDEISTLQIPCKNFSRSLAQMRSFSISRLKALTSVQFIDDDDCMFPTLSILSIQYSALSSFDLIKNGNRFFPSLTTLTLTNNRLIQLPSPLNHSSLLQLDLSHNEIEVADFSLLTTPSLAYFHLSHNRLASVSITAATTFASSLYSLKLDNNALTEINAAALTQCDSLDLSYDNLSPLLGLSRLPPSLSTLLAWGNQRLQTIDDDRSNKSTCLLLTSLEANGCGKLAKIAPVLLLTLTNLRCVGCRLSSSSFSSPATTTSSSVCNSTFPFFIDLGHNELTDIEFLSAHVSVSSRIETLIINNNQIHDLPPSTMASLRSLKALDVSNNHLSHLSIEESSSPRLQRLIARNNSKLASLALRLPPSLDVLDVGQCNFSSLPPLTLLKQLKTLAIGSRLTFKSLATLESLVTMLNQSDRPPFELLDLSFNQLAGEPPRWLFQSTRVLLLAHNQLTTLSDIWSLGSGDLYVDWLDVSNNELGGKAPFLPTSTLRVLDLSSNQFEGQVAKTTIPYVSYQNNSLLHYEHLNAPQYAELKAREPWVVFNQTLTCLTFYRKRRLVDSLAPLASDIAVPLDPSYASYEHCRCAFGYWGQGSIQCTRCDDIYKPLHVANCSLGGEFLLFSPGYYPEFFQRKGGRGRQLATNFIHCHHQSHIACNPTGDSVIEFIDEWNQRVVDDSKLCASGYEGRACASCTCNDEVCFAPSGSASSGRCVQCSELNLNAVVCALVAAFALVVVFVLVGTSSKTSELLLLLLDIAFLAAIFVATGVQSPLISIVVIMVIIQVLHLLRRWRRRRQQRRRVLLSELASSLANDGGEGDDNGSDHNDNVEGFLPSRGIIVGGNDEHNHEQHEKHELQHLLLFHVQSLMVVGYASLIPPSITGALNNAAVANVQGHGVRCLLYQLGIRNLSQYSPALDIGIILTAPFIVLLIAFALILLRLAYINLRLRMDKYAFRRMQRRRARRRMEQKENDDDDDNDDDDEDDNGDEVGGSIQSAPLLSVEEINSANAADTIGEDEDDDVNDNQWTSVVGYGGSQMLERERRRLQSLSLVAKIAHLIFSVAHFEGVSLSIELLACDEHGFLHHFPYVECNAASMRFAAATAVGIGGVVVYIVAFPLLSFARDSHMSKKSNKHEWWMDSVFIARRILLSSVLAFVVDQGAGVQGSGYC